jgi:hypothetical protein
MGLRANLIDQRFGRLVCIKRLRPGRSGTVWLFRCDCGGTTEATTGDVTRARKPRTTCGCARKEPRPRRRRGRDTRTASVWRAMWQRCTNPAHPRFANYGGRGISVCDRWRDYALFLEDMGQRPEGLEIDRIDSNGHYEPRNCRWVTSAENNRNRRCVRLVQGLPVTVLARREGVPPSSLRLALSRGLPIDEALTYVKSKQRWPSADAHDVENVL